MANQIEDRRVDRREGKAGYLPLATGEAFFVGSAVFRDSSGEAKRPDTTTTDFCVGVAEEQVDQADGDAEVRFSAGIADFAISGSDPVTNADIGNTVFAEDDQTVRQNNSTPDAPPMGTLFLIEGGRAFVKVGVA